jgi:two-component system phosphate regulon response regulator PhoB
MTPQREKAAQGNKNGPLILVVEDDDAIMILVHYNLEAEGFRVAKARDGEDALLQVKETPPDLILLDWMLPLVSGIEVCRRLRQTSETSSIPIILLTARGEESDKVRGLDVGADDYITKPFSPNELVARVQALLRRSRPQGFSEVLRYHNIEMDLASHRVRRDGQEIHLGPTEYRLLRYFLQRPERVFSREQLLDAVWGRDIFVEQRTVDVHIRRLRKALNVVGEVDIIRTVRSAGYALDMTSPDDDLAVG